MNRNPASDDRDSSGRNCCPRGHEERERDPVQRDLPVGGGVQAPKQDDPRLSLSPRQRMVLSRLRLFGGETSAVQLAQEVATQYSNSPHSEVSSGEMRRLYVELQVDLQELARQNLISYSEQSGRVILTAMEDANRWDPIG